MCSHKHLLAGYVMPHPPVIVPGVSKEPHLAQRTVAAMREVSRDIANLQPDTVVVISPHAPMFSDYLYFYENPVLEGSLARFGAPGSEIRCTEDTALREKINQLLQKRNISGGGLDRAQMNRFGIDTELDHGVVVPLYFACEACKFKLVAMSSSDLPLDDLYNAGMVIRQAAESMDRRIVVIASGDQSHKVNQESPYGFSPDGRIYDEEVCSSFTEGDLINLLQIDARTRKNAAECGYRSMVILAGTFDRQSVVSSLLSYEAPYGIGYCVASLKSGGKLTESVPGAWEEAKKDLKAKLARFRDNESFPVMVARKTLETEVKNNHRLNVADFYSYREEQESFFSRKAGVFVSLKKEGDLRGCIGTTAASTGSIVAEIIQNAISAGLRDPRFSPVEAEELPFIEYSVDVLGEPEPVNSKNDLDPVKYGVIVSSGRRSGLLLPALEGVDTVQQQLEIACRKAGISSDKDFQIQRFEVTRYY